VSRLRPSSIDNPKPTPLHKTDARRVLKQTLVYQLLVTPMMSALQTLLFALLEVRGCIHDVSRFPPHAPCPTLHPLYIPASTACPHSHATLRQGSWDARIIAQRCARAASHTFVVDTMMRALLSKYIPVQQRAVWSDFCAAILSLGKAGALLGLVYAEEKRPSRLPIFASSPPARPAPPPPHAL